MDYRNQLTIREAVNKRFNNFRNYNYKNDRAKVISFSKTVEDIVNVLDIHLDIDDISVTVFDEIVCLVADEALEMSFHQFRNHVWLLSESCNLSVYNAKVTTKDLFHRINWDSVYSAFEKEVQYGV